MRALFLAVAGALPLAGQLAAQTPDEARRGATPDSIGLAATTDAEPATETGRADVWSIETPHSGVPYRVARLSGTIDAGGRRLTSQLSIGCRHDQPPVLTLAFEVPAEAGGLGFDPSAFEGPEGVGQERELLRFDGGDGGDGVALPVSGWWSGRHAFTFAPLVPLDPRIADAITAAARTGSGHWRFAVLSPDPWAPAEPLLVAQFRLPDDGSPLAAIEPCLAAERHPAPAPPAR